MRIILLNGSVGGRTGNSARVSEWFSRELTNGSPDRVVEHLFLGERSTSDVLVAVDSADAVVFLTGTYWDSWGSPLQRFLEEATPSEGTSVWLGKPTAVLVTAHSVGGKGVLSRLQGVLNTFGCLIPPMTGWVFTAATQQALETAEALRLRGLEVADDFWSVEDLRVVAHNLVTGVRGGKDYRSWPVDRQDPHKVWLTPVAE